MQTSLKIGFAQISLAAQKLWAHTPMGGTRTSFEEAIPKSFYSVLIRHMRFIRITHKRAIHFVTINNNNNNNNNM